MLKRGEIDMSHATQGDRMTAKFTERRFRKFSTVITALALAAMLDAVAMPALAHGGGGGGGRGGGGGGYGGGYGFRGGFFGGFGGFGFYDPFWGYPYGAYPYGYPAYAYPAPLRLSLWLSCCLGAARCGPATRRTDRAAASKRMVFLPVIEGLLSLRLIVSGAVATGADDAPALTQSKFGNGRAHGSGRRSRAIPAGRSPFSLGSPRGACGIWSSAASSLRRCS